MGTLYLESLTSACLPALISEQITNGNTTPFQGVVPAFQCDRLKVQFQPHAHTIPQLDVRVNHPAKEGGKITFKTAGEYNQRNVWRVGSETCFKKYDRLTTNDSN